MAGNLVAKGWPVTVLADRKRDAVERPFASGASEAKSPKELALAEVVILSVTGSDQVQQVPHGVDGIIADGRRLFVIDCSTSNPSVTTWLAEERRSRA